ncbi:MAG: AraC family transcriptional regulator, partial [Nitrosopumilaceae archaeon]|nr:AraC family transcriptional regulator [Nitrosopumilaceae archaeon]NIU88148.1 AraC family transcriptional regulator [Nitrosopumilaceae archaeon]NIX63184.1 AraC family transcriptional regulator [Nitrosopumilaceae archaeon]
QVGFRSLSHFAKVFKQQYGQTPSEFAATRANDD